MTAVPSEAFASSCRSCHDSTHAPREALERPRRLDEERHVAAVLQPLHHVADGALPHAPPQPRAQRLRIVVGRWRLDVEASQRLHHDRNVTGDEHVPMQLESSALQMLLEEESHRNPAARQLVREAADLRIEPAAAALLEQGGAYRVTFGPLPHGVHSVLGALGGGSMGARHPPRAFA